jgi:hypothetical protein
MSEHVMFPGAQGEGGELAEAKQILEKLGMLKDKQI